jgi:hypothetical protein
VENILFDEVSAVRIAATASPNLSEPDIAARLAYDGWINRVRRAFRELFVLYAAAQELAPEIPTVSFKVTKLCNNSRDGPEPSLAKVRRRRRDVMHDLLQRFSLSEVLATRRRIRRRASRLSQAVSGKDYILPLLYIRLCKQFGYRGQLEQFKVDLASRWHTSLEPWFAAAVTRTAA